MNTMEKKDLALPSKLYKYLPAQFVSDVREKGVLLFRSLSYFQRLEGDAARGDYFEGMHVDHPDNDVTIPVLDTGQVIKGDMAYLNQTKSEDIYCFCLSTELSDELVRAFGATACIEISDVPEFTRRVRKAVGRLKSAADWEVDFRPLAYYNSNEAATIDIKNPRNLPFFKPVVYAEQAEFRIIAARKTSFELTQAIIDWKNYDFREEFANKKSKEMRFRVGPIADISKVLMPGGSK